MVKTIDYIINTKPVSIEFDCPECGETTLLPFEDRFWGNDGYVFVRCCECGEEFELGNYDID